MFIKTRNQAGVAALASGTAFLSGQIVVQTVDPTEPTRALATVVASTGDSLKRFGIAYTNPADVVWRRGMLVFNASNASNETERITAGDRMTILYELVEGSTNQVDDGTYNPGDPLTINWATARFRVATGNDVKYGEVQRNFPGRQVVAQNFYVPLFFRNGGV